MTTTISSVLSRLKRAHWLMIAFIVAITALAMVLRHSLFPYLSGDYYDFLQHWFRTLRNYKGLRALAFDIGDYTPTYLYVLKAVSYLPFEDYVCIKIGSSIADIVLAAYCALITHHFYRNRHLSVLCYGVILFLPSVFVNSAVWAQCDAIYTAALVACFYYFLKGRSWGAMIAFSISFIFKLQSIFLAPFLLILWIKGRVKFRQFFTVPAVYLLSILPAVYKGRDFVGLLTVYFHQTQTYSDRLTMLAPNFYSWVSDDWADIFSPFGILFTLAVMLGLAYFAFTLRHKIVLDDDILLHMALLSVLVLPFIMPHMHERYFYPADIFSVLYLFRNPRKFYVTAIICLCSQNSCLQFLFGVFPIPLGYQAIALLFVIAALSRDLFCRLAQAGATDADAAPPAPPEPPDLPAPA